MRITLEHTMHGERFDIKLRYGLIVFVHMYRGYHKEGPHILQQSIAVRDLYIEHFVSKYYFYY